ncbi:hypothetical protein [Foetidibacter luteolus]|uniref:hypothetical protein n=1 Tax=Foetidibacter luteolus TaxID=2608880 RepID=UPI00129B6E37|nr:hypothetical protein [Foetidibacter luteolus]
MNKSVTLIGEVSFAHYNCIVTASLFADDAAKPNKILLKPHTDQDELGEEILFLKQDSKWLTEYSLPVLHSDTYKNIVERLLEYITK